MNRINELENRISELNIDISNYKSLELRAKKEVEVLSNTLSVNLQMMENIKNNNNLNNNQLKSKMFI